MCRKTFSKYYIRWKIFPHWSTNRQQKIEKKINSWLLIKRKIKFFIKGSWMGIIQNLRRKCHFNALQSFIEVAASIKAYHLTGGTPIENSSLTPRPGNRVPYGIWWQL